MKIKFWGVLLFCLIMKSLPAQTVQDIDGNVYKTVTIGTQIWMAENLKTSKLIDGTEIPLATIPGNEWAEHTVSASITPMYCWPWDSASVYKDIYGAFYNGYAISSAKICPTGWHVPSDAEWTTLSSYLGGDEVAGGKLKEKGDKFWNSPNNAATNETGFTARAGGSIADNGANWDFRYNCFFWTSTTQQGNNLWTRYINFNVGSIQKLYADRHVGYPVRCVNDTPAINSDSPKAAKQAPAGEKKPEEMVTIRNDKFQFEVSVPKSWSVWKGFKPDPDEAMRTGDNPSFVIPGNDGDSEPKNWNGIATQSPFVHIYANEKSVQNQEEFIKLFERLIAELNSKVVSINKTFTVADAKGFNINYIVGLNNRITVLYKNGIRVIIYYIEFPGKDSTAYKKDAAEIEEVIRSIRIK